MDHPALSPEQIIAEFQRRRRLTFRIRKWAAGLGLGGVFGGMLLLGSLHGLQDPPYWLFAGMVAALGIFVFGAFFTPHLYRSARTAAACVSAPPIRLKPATPLSKTRSRARTAVPF